MPWIAIECGTPQAPRSLRSLTLPALRAILAFLLLEVAVPPLAEPVYAGPKKATRFAVIDQCIRAAERKLNEPQIQPRAKTIDLSAANAKSIPPRSVRQILTQAPRFPIFLRPWSWLLRKGKVEQEATRQGFTRVLVAVAILAVMEFGGGLIREDGQFVQIN